MAKTEILYNGEVIATLEPGETKKLTCDESYMVTDVIVQTVEDEITNGGEN